MELKLRGPHNLFRLDESAQHYVLIAGGIGITPILAMADRLRALGRDYIIHYAGRSRTSMAFLMRLSQDHGERLRTYAKEEGQRLNLQVVVESLPEGGQIYACGPARMISALEDLSSQLPDDAVHVEHFSTAAAGLDPQEESPFEVELADSGLTISVAADETLLEAIRSVGIDIASDCCEGLCGSCEVAVLEGEIDHRDLVLSRSERAGHSRMMACCSRAAKGGRLKLAL